MSAQRPSAPVFLAALAAGFILAGTSPHVAHAAGGAAAIQQQATYQVLVTAEGDSGTTFTDKLTDDGVQTINTLSGGPTVTSTSVLNGAQSALFDNTGERFQFVGSAAGLGTQFTLGAFVDANQTQNTLRLFSNYNGGPIAGTDLLWDNVNSLNEMRFFIDGQQGSFPLFDFNAAGPTHIAATVDGDQVSVFIDGMLHGTTETVGDGVFTLSPDLHFGEDVAGTSLTNEPFLGEADDVFLINQVLTPDDLSFIATNGADAFFFPAEVPEPGTFLLFALAASAVGGLAWRRRRAAAA